MGETEQYERMMDELREEQVKEAHARMEARNAVEKEKEAAYWAACAEHGIQDNSPYRLKDVVLHVPTRREGKVIGLPLKSTVGRYDLEDHSYQAWIHFTDGTRSWINWADLQELHRSPPERAATLSEPGAAAPGSR